MSMPCLEIRPSITTGDDVIFNTILSHSWSIIEAAGCCYNGREEIQCRKLSGIIADLLFNHRDDLSEIAWLAADRFVTEQTNGCGGK